MDLQDEGRTPGTGTVGRSLKGCSVVRATHRNHSEDSVDQSCSDSGVDGLRDPCTFEDLCGVIKHLRTREETRLSGSQTAPQGSPA